MVNILRTLGIINAAVVLGFGIYLAYDIATTDALAEDPNSIENVYSY